MFFLINCAARRWTIGSRKKQSEACSLISLANAYSLCQAVMIGRLTWSSRWADTVSRISRGALRPPPIKVTDSSLMIDNAIWFYDGVGRKARSLPYKRKDFHYARSLERSRRIKYCTRTWFCLRGNRGKIIIRRSCSRLLLELGEGNRATWIWIVGGKIFLRHQRERLYKVNSKRSKRSN